MKRCTATASVLKVHCKCTKKDEKKQFPNFKKSLKHFLKSTFFLMAKMDRNNKNFLSETTFYRSYKFGCLLDLTVSNLLYFMFCFSHGVSMVCEIEAYPAPSITWTKEFSDFKLNPKLY